MLGHLEAEGQGLGQKAAPIPTSHSRHKEGDFMAYPPCNLDLVVRGQGFGVVLVPAGAPSNDAQDRHYQGQACDAPLPGE